MTNNTLPARDVAFLTALADYILALGADRAADAIYAAVETGEPTEPTGEWA